MSKSGDTSPELRSPEDGTDTETSDSSGVNLAGMFRGREVVSRGQRLMQGSGRFRLHN